MQSEGSLLLLCRKSCLLLLQLVLESIASLLVLILPCFCLDICPGIGDGFTGGWLVGGWWSWVGLGVGLGIGLGLDSLGFPCKQGTHVAHRVKVLSLVRQYCGLDCLNSRMGIRQYSLLVFGTSKVIPTSIKSS